VSILTLVFAVFILWANPSDKYNRWSSTGFFIIFLGIFSSALNQEIFPTFNIRYPEDLFFTLNSFFLWMIMVFLMPTWTIAGCYISYVQYKNNWFSKNWETIKYLLYTPVLVLVFFFSPLKILEYRDISISFWVTFSIYNLSFGLIMLIIAVKGILYEKELLKEKSLFKKERNRRLQEAIVLLPPMYVTLLSFFPGRLIIVLIGPEHFNYLHDLWQVNFIVIPICLFAAIYLAIFGGGFLGIRIIPARYSFILTNDAFMANFAHRMKSQTRLMYYDIDQIKKSMYSGQDPVIVEHEVDNHLEKLLHKIRNINDISSKINRYSSTIQYHQLDIKNWCLKDLINDALSNDTDVKISISIDESVRLNCEKALMIEVFKDIIDNGIQSIQAEPSQKTGAITITGSRDRARGKCVIMFADNGIGIPLNRLQTIFRPGESTKNKDYNTGMGLANSKKIIDAHGGDIFADSQGIGKGATIVIKLP